MEAKLYVILGSHACRSGMLMLDHKGIDYETVELPPGLHPFLLRLHGFSGNSATFRRVDGRSNVILGSADRMGTVPALMIDGVRVKQNREIARHLDRVRPDPPLFPADPVQRREVEEAERWGDEVFQMAARRMALTGALHGRDFMANRGNEGRLGPLLWRNETVRWIGVRTVARAPFRANAQSESELLASLPPMLDRIDAWIEAGVLNGDELCAADFVIAPSIALLSYRIDLRPEIERRPAGALADRLLPEPDSVRTAYASGHVSQHSHTP
jgi:glutathione S-transferase